MSIHAIPAGWVPPGGTRSVSYTAGTPPTGRPTGVQAPSPACGGTVNGASAVGVGRSGTVVVVVEVWSSGLPPVDRSWQAGARRWRQAFPLRTRRRPGKRRTAPRSLASIVCGATGRRYSAVRPRTQGVQRHACSGTVLRPGHAQRRSSEDASTWSRPRARGHRVSVPFEEAVGSDGRAAHHHELRRQSGALAAIPFSGDQRQWALVMSAPAARGRAWPPRLQKANPQVIEVRIRVPPALLLL